VKKKTVVISLVIISAILAFIFFGVVLYMALSGGTNMQVMHFGNSVARINLYGEIYDSRNFVRQVEKYTSDNSIKAIVVDINSPGGGVAPSHEMYTALLKAREEGKIVVASFSSVAASGGYYVGCAADRIVSNPGCLTGSIGVILSFPTASKLMDKIGVRWETITSGELKDVGNFSRDMTEQEGRMLKAVIDDVYEQFVEAVSLGRDKPVEEVYALADGSIFSGRQAYNLGLVDTLGTLDDAITIAGEMSGLGSDPDVVIERPREPGLFDFLTGLTRIMEQMSNIDARSQGLMYLYSH